MRESNPKGDEQERPPLFRSWSGWYVFVLAFLVLQIILYYLLTDTFR